MKKLLFLCLIFSIRILFYNYENKIRVGEVVEIQKHPNGCFIKYKYSESNFFIGTSYKIIRDTECKYSLKELVK